MATPHTAMTLDVYLWNDDEPDNPHHHRIVTGVRERLRAKIHFKKPIDEVLSGGDEEGMVYLAYLGCQRYGVVDEELAYEEFVDQLFAVDPEGVEEAQQQAIAAAAAALSTGDAGDEPGEGDAGRGRDQG